MCTYSESTFTQAINQRTAAYNIFHSDLLFFSAICLCHPHEETELEWVNQKHCINPTLDRLTYHVFCFCLNIAVTQSLSIYVGDEHTIGQQLDIVEMCGSNSLAHGFYVRDYISEEGIL